MSNIITRFWKTRETLEQFVYVMLVLMLGMGLTIDCNHSAHCWSISGEQGVDRVCGRLDRHGDGSLSVGDMTYAAGSWKSVRKVEK